MRQYIFIFISILMAVQLQAQQDEQYTQFFFNKLALNPAYAGSDEGACLTALYRNQWIGLEGAPTTQAFSFHTGILDGRVGLGLSVVHDNIGPTDSWRANLAYAYRIRLETGTLGIGLQGSLRRYQVDFMAETTTHPGDNLIQSAEPTTTLANIGAGVYYESDKFYVGLSIPHFIKSDISLLPSTFTTTNITSREELHLYGMAGLILPISNDVKFKPAVLYKYVQNAPVDFDINASLLFMDRFLFGLTYRTGGSLDSTGESLDLVAQYNVTQAFRIGAAYDFTLSELSNYNNGSFEIMAQYCIGRKEQVTNPRFF